MNKPRWMDRGDPEVLARLRGQASLWRSAERARNDERAKLNRIILEAKQTGSSYRQIYEATGLSIQAIQMVLAKAGYKEPDQR